MTSDDRDSRDRDRARGLSPAHSHPELIGGDIASRPPRFAAPASNALPRARLPLRGMALAAALAALSMFAGFGGAMAFLLADRPIDMAVVSRAATDALPVACVEADAKALDVLLTLLRGAADADLRISGDAIFRLRRARRNCRTGWVALAQSDYAAIYRFASLSRPMSPSR